MIKHDKRNNKQKEFKLTADIKNCQIQKPTKGTTRFGAEVVCNIR